MRGTLTNDQLKDKLSDEDKKSIEDISNEGNQFLESNPDADASEFEAKQKELEAKFNPIMQKVYQQSAPTGPNNDMRGAAQESNIPETPVDDLD